MKIDRKYLLWGLAYAIAGMGLGIYMSASHNHTQHVTHAHILLVGFVVSLIYAIIYKVWLKGVSSGLARIQFITHQAGTLAMIAGLLMLFGNVVPEAKLAPLLAVASLAVFIAALMMYYLVVRAK